MHRHRVWIAVGLLVAGCSPAPEATVEQTLARVQALVQSGDLEAAGYALRNAIASHPDSATLHLRLARLELASGRGDLAQSSIDKARQLGADEATLVELTARALALAGERLALADLTVTDDLPVATRFVVRMLQARALADDELPLPGEVFDAYFALYRLRETLPPPDAARLSDAGVFDELERARSSHPEAERALAHLRCAQTAPAVVRWSPGPIDASRRRLRVGPGQRYPRIVDAAAAAGDGDVIEIEAGDYPGAVATWPQHGLLIRGVGGRPHIAANDQRVADRDVWLFTGDDVVVENVEISGARSPKYNNGAAIRHIGRNLTLRHVHLHHSENGVLIGNDYPDTNRVLVEYSQFGFNGDGVGYAHNLYIGRSHELVMRYSYSHDATGGHLLKSRASRTVLEYNRLSDEAGNSSYVIDIPNGGDALVLGNVLEQGARAVNKYVISFAAEEPAYPVSELRVINNTLYNRTYNGVFVHQYLEVPTQVINNVAIGTPLALVESDHLAGITREANLTRVDHGLESPRDYRFALTFDSPAVDAGTAIAPAPQREYVHPVGWRKRQTVDRLDIGAYEACRGTLVSASASAQPSPPQ
jgi:hypothetical protein